MPDTHRSGQHSDGHRDDTPDRKRDRARAAGGEATRRAAQGIDANPLGILVGGLAVGALAGALIPRSAREKELLAPVGKRLGEGARAAAQAAKDAGRAELENNGLTADAGRDQVKSLLGNVAKAIATAGAAGAKAATGKAGA